MAGGVFEVNMQRTLFVSDLDGTLLNSSAELSEYSTRSLSSFIQKGIKFSVATARTLVTTEKILSKLVLHLPIILMNGVLIYDIKKKSYINVNYFKPQIVKEIIETLRNMKLRVYCTN